MNAFVRHHQPAIAFGYHCFDRLLGQAYVSALQWGGNIASFLRDRRRVPAITPAYFRGLSGEFHRALEARVAAAGLPLVEPPAGVRREEFVAPYYRALGGQPGVAVLLRCREKARVAVSYPKRACHLEMAWRFVNLYYLYVQDAALGRLWLRLCPYFPFNAQFCVNGHEWLAGQLRREGIGFRQDDNAFLACDDPGRLQALADAFGPEHLTAALDPYLRQWVPFFTDHERAQGYRHRLSLSQVEYCTNLVFRSQAALDRLFARLLDHNRAIGHPANLAVIFGRARFVPDTRTGQSEVKVTALKTPVLRTGFGSTALKQYVKGRTLLRTETSCYRLQDLSVPKGVEHLPRLRAVLGASNERLLDAQQDVLASYVDRGQLERLRQPTVSAAGRRTPGLRLDDPRLLAVLQAVTSFAYLVGHACFRSRDLLDDVRRALDQPGYTLSQLRYDLAKLRGKGLVARRPRTQRYELSPEGYRLAVLYQKLYHRLYAPLTAGILDPVAEDHWLPPRRKAKLDRRYEAVDKALQALSEEVGVFAA
jgi:hypothetical protein